MTTKEQALREILVTGLSTLSLELSAHKIDQLLVYITEFAKWNKAYNLSAIRDPEQMVSRHLLDSLSVVSFFQQQHANVQRVIDVGTGGGLPGIPLAIVFPERHFTLLDSNGKKTRFLFHVKTLLGLTQVTVENRRVESFHPEPLFDAVISRAFASLKDMVDGCKNLLHEQGIFMAMKGIYPAEELAEVDCQVELTASYRLQVPATEGERHLLILTPRR